MTTTGSCGFDLHLYEVLGAFLDAGDILGHEPMGVVEEVGPDVTAVKPGDRVVIPSASTLYRSVWNAPGGAASTPWT